MKVRLDMNKINFIFGFIWDLFAFIFEAIADFMIRTSEKHEWLMPVYFAIGIILAGVIEAW